MRSLFNILVSIGCKNKIKTVYCTNSFILTHVFIKMCKWQT